MAKKTSSKKPPAPKIIKLFLTEEQSHRIRVAAALSNKSPGDYARDIVLALAMKATSGIELGKRDG